MQTQNSQPYKPTSPARNQRAINEDLEMKTTRTKRGFDLSEFKDRNGSECSLQNSSIATEPAIWLGINNANPQIMCSDAKKLGFAQRSTVGWQDFRVPDEVLFTTRMHLTQDMAAELIEALQVFVETGSIPSS